MQFLLEKFLWVMMLSEWFALLLLFGVPFLLGIGATLLVQWLLRARAWRRATRGRWI